MAKRAASKSVNIKNKRATFDYELIDTYTAGIVLTGTEIKSIRDSNASYNNHEAKRDRKLLLTRKELRKLASDSKNPGYTIVPTRLFIGDKGLAKLVIALAKGKHEFDKRQSIKDNEDKKAIARAFLV